MLIMSDSACHFVHIFSCLFEYDDLSGLDLTCEMIIGCASVVINVIFGLPNYVLTELVVRHEASFGS